MDGSLRAPVLGGYQGLLFKDTGSREECCERAKSTPQTLRESSMQHVRGCLQLTHPKLLQQHV